MSLSAYAKAFGMLFQVTDDLLDVESTAEAAGKRVNKDTERGKLTYPGLIGIDSRPRGLAAIGQPVSVCHQLSITGMPRMSVAQ